MQLVCGVDLADSFGWVGCAAYPDHVHPQCRSLARQRAADVTKPDDTERLPG